MSITLGGTAIPSPSKLTERNERLYSETIALDGSRQRNFVNNRNLADLAFGWISAVDFRTIKNLLTSGYAVVYNNTDTGVSFTCFGTFTSGAYYRGTGAYKDLKVILTENV